jgi:hypothetical protein
MIADRRSELCCGGVTGIQIDPPVSEGTVSASQRKISEINDRIKIEEAAGSSSPVSLYRQLDAARLEYKSFQNALYVPHRDLRHVFVLTKKGGIDAFELKSGYSGQLSRQTRREG